MTTDLHRIGFRIARPRHIHVLLLVLFSLPFLTAYEIPSRNATSETASPLDVAPGELILAVVIMRHGDRVPQHHAPSFAAGDRDSLVGRSFPIDDVPWSVDYGQLSEIGMQQSRDIGARLRQRYVISPKGQDRGFISADYKHAETHVRAADVDRTLVSAMNAMLGLYGGGEERAEVPVHTVEYARDKLMDGSAKKHCPRFYDMGMRMLGTEFCRGAIMRSTELLKALPRLTGYSVEGMSFPRLVDLIASLRDLRVAQRAHGVEKGENVTMFDDTLDDIVARVSIAKWDMSGLGGLVGGRLLRAIGRRMQSVVELVSGGEDVLSHSREECNANGSDSDEDGGCPRKLVFYVGHDTTIFDIRAALGIPAVVSSVEGSGGVASFAAHVIFELRREKNKKKSRKMKGTSDEVYTVQVLTGSYLTETHEVAGPFCGGKKKCGLISFLEYIQNRIPTDIDAACEVIDTTGGASVEARVKSLSKFSIPSWGSVLVATVVGALFGYLAGVKRHRTDYSPIHDSR